MEPDNNNQMRPPFLLPLRARVDPRLGKNIRKDSGGFENFRDYFSVSSPAESVASVHDEHHHLRRSRSSRVISDITFPSFSLNASSHNSSASRPSGIMKLRSRGSTEEPVAADDVSVNQPDESGRPKGTKKSKEFKSSKIPHLHQSIAAAHSFSSGLQTQDAEVRRSLRSRKSLPNVAKVVPNNALIHTTSELQVDDPEIVENSPDLMSGNATDMAATSDIRTDKRLPDESQRAKRLSVIDCNVIAPRTSSIRRVSVRHIESILEEVEIENEPQHQTSDNVTERKILIEEVAIDQNGVDPTALRNDVVLENSHRKSSRIVDRTRTSNVLANRISNVTSRISNSQASRHSSADEDVQPTRASNFQKNRMFDDDKTDDEVGITDPVDNNENSEDGSVTGPGTSANEEQNNNRKKSKRKKKKKSDMFTMKKKRKESIMVAYRQQKNSTTNNHTDNANGNHADNATNNLVCNTTNSYADNTASHVGNTDKNRQSNITNNHASNTAKNRQSNITNNRASTTANNRESNTNNCASNASNNHASNTANNRECNTTNNRESNTNNHASNTANNRESNTNNCESNSTNNHASNTTNNHASNTTNGSEGQFSLNLSPIEPAPRKKYFAASTPAVRKMSVRRKLSAINIRTSATTNRVSDIVIAEENTAGSPSKSRAALSCIRKTAADVELPHDVEFLPHSEVTSHIEAAERNDSIPPVEVILQGEPIAQVEVTLQDEPIPQVGVTLHREAPLQNEATPSANLASTSQPPFYDFTPINSVGAPPHSSNLRTRGGRDPLTLTQPTVHHQKRLGGRKSVSFMPSRRSSTATSKDQSTRLPNFSTAEQMHYFEMTGQEPALTPTPIKRKIIYARGSDQTNGLRRSKRTRVIPLDFHKNERVKYGHDEYGLVVEGIIPGSKTPARANRARQIIQRHIRLAEKKERERRHAEGELSIHVPLTENLIQSDSNVIKAIDINTNEVVEHECFFNCHEYEKISLTTRKPAVDEDPLVMIKPLQLPNVSSGILEIRPLEQKKVEYLGAQLQIFFIIWGKVEVRIHQSSAILQTNDIFYVPPGNIYGIKNLRKEVARLSFTTVKYVPIDENIPPPVNLDASLENSRRSPV